MQEVITEAKKFNISVVPWLEFGFAASVDDYKPNSGILEKYPHWAAINNTNQSVIVEGFHWMNPFLPDV